MELQFNRFYFISDSFFHKVQDPYLKQNHETTKRPHYYAFQDEETSLYWMIPCSSQVEKYQRIIEKKEMRHQKTDAIQIVKIQEKKSALLFQDMFPCSRQYIEGMYIRRKVPLSIGDPNIVQHMERIARQIVVKLRMGVRFTPTQPDIKRIENMLLLDIQKETKSKAIDLHEKLSLAQERADTHNQNVHKEYRSANKSR